MRNKIFAISIVTVLMITAFAGIGNGAGLRDYLNSNTLSNVIDSTRAENVIVEIPLKDGENGEYLINNKKVFVWWLEQKLKNIDLKGEIKRKIFDF